MNHVDKIMTWETQGVSGGARTLPGGARTDTPRMSECRLDGFRSSAGAPGRVSFPHGAQVGRLMSVNS
jgi:hypothetical protein